MLLLLGMWFEQEEVVSSRRILSRRNEGESSETQQRQPSYINPRQVRLSQNSLRERIASTPRPSPNKGSSFTRCHPPNEANIILSPLITFCRITGSCRRFQTQCKWWSRDSKPHSGGASYEHSIPALHRTNLQFNPSQRPLMIYPATTSRDNPGPRAPTPNAVIPPTQSYLTPLHPITHSNNIKEKSSLNDQQKDRHKNKPAHEPVCAFARPSAHININTSEIKRRNTQKRKSTRYEVESRGRREGVRA